MADIYDPEFVEMAIDEFNRDMDELNAEIDRNNEVDFNEDIDQDKIIEFNKLTMEKLRLANIKLNRHKESNDYCEFLHNCDNCSLIHYLMMIALTEENDNMHIKDNYLVTFINGMLGLTDEKPKINDNHPIVLLVFWSYFLIKCRVYEISDHPLIDLYEEIGSDVFYALKEIGHLSEDNFNEVINILDPLTQIIRAVELFSLDICVNCGLDKTLHYGKSVGPWKPLPEKDCKCPPGKYTRLMALSYLLALRTTQSEDGSLILSFEETYQIPLKFDTGYAGYAINAIFVDRFMDIITKFNESYRYKVSKRVEVF